MIEDIAVELKWNSSVNREEAQFPCKCNRPLLETAEEIE